MSEEKEALTPPKDRNLKNITSWPATPSVPRTFQTAFTGNFLSDYHRGVMNYKYKGVSCLKSPIDLAIYMMLIFEQKPQTIIEIGSYNGGAALFYRDLCKNYGLDTTIITVDNRELENNPTTKLNADTGVEFINADAENLAESELHQRLGMCPRPWLIIEDSAHTRDVTYAVIDYFKDLMQSGEYLIVEDGVIEDQGGNHRYYGGPNLAIHDFFKLNPDTFTIDENYNDFFGLNATFNPNGYLRKT